MNNTNAQTTGAAAPTVDIGAIITDAMQHAKKHRGFDTAQNIRAYLLEQSSFNSYDERFTYTAIKAYLTTQE